MKTNAEKMVTSKQLAGFFGVTPRWLRQLRAQGMPAAERGRYPFVKSTRWYIGYLRRALEARDGADGDLVLELRRARLRRLCASATEAEMKLAACRRELVPIAAVENTWASHVQAVKAKFLSLPARISSELENEPGEKIRALLDSKIRQILVGLAAQESTPRSKPA